MYQKVGSTAYKADLNNSIALDKYLGHPHKRFRTIHIGGTNGKGSVSHMIASVLQTAGYNVGLYTSPHLKDFRERIKVDGKVISKKYVIVFVKKHRRFFEKLKPSFFEITVAMAFDYFAYKKVDVGIIEVGLGGRLDSTNILYPMLSVITNVGFDHTNFLGNTFQKIASEKAGIFKKNIPVIIGETQKETKDIFIAKAKKNNNIIFFADQIYSLKQHTKTNCNSYNIFKHRQLLYDNLKIGLFGDYQKMNLITTIAVIEQIKELGFKITKDDIYKGFSSIVYKTGLKGRWQILDEKPLTIADIAHNFEGLQLVFKQIEKMNFSQLHVIFGLSDGKDIDKIMGLFPEKAFYYMVKANVSRGIRTSILSKYADIYNINYQEFSSVKKGYKHVREKANYDDIICITGSTFVVAEIL